MTQWTCWCVCELAGVWYPYQESIVVPLIMYDSNTLKHKVGTAVNSFTLNVGHAVRSLCTAGIKSHDTIQGMDMADFSLLTDSTRDEALSRWYLLWIHGHKWELLSIEQHIDLERTEADLFVPSWQLLTIWFGERSSWSKHSQVSETSRWLLEMWDILKDPNDCCESCDKIIVGYILVGYMWNSPLPSIHLRTATRPQTTARLQASTCWQQCDH